MSRPDSERAALMADLIATERSGRALHIPLQGRTTKGIRQSLYNPLKRRGYRLHLIRDGAAWARGWVSPVKRKRRTA